MNIITPPDSAVLFLQTLLHKYSQHAPSRTVDVAATTPAVLGSAATDVDALTQSAANGGQQVEGVHRSSARKRGRHHLDAGPQADRPGQLSHRKRNKPCNAADRAEEYLARRVKALQQNKHGLQAAWSTSETATATARTGCSMQAMQAAQKVEHSATCNQATVSAQRMKQLNGCDQVVGQTHQPSDALQPSPSAVPCSALPHQLAAAAVAAGLDAVIQHQLAAEAGLSSASAPPAVPAGCADDSSDELMDLWNAGLRQDNLTPQHAADDDDRSGKWHQSNNPTDFRSEHKAAVAPVAAAGCEGHGVQQAVGSGAAAAGDVQLPEQQATVVTREHGHHSGWDTHLMTDVVICPAARQQTQLSTAAAATEDTTAGPEQQQQPPQDATPGPALMFEQPPSVVSFRPPFLPHAIRKTTLKASTTTAAAAESDKRFTLASLLFAVPELPIRQQSEVPQTGRTKQKVKQQPSASTAQLVINSRPVAGLTTGVTVAVSDLTTVAGAGAAATAVGDFLCGAVAKQGPLATRHEAASATAASAVTGKIHAVPLSSDEEGEIADDDQEEDHGGQQQQQQQQEPATAVNNSASAAATEHPRKRKKSRGGRQVRQRQQRAAAERAAERAAAAASGASGAQGLYAEIKQWEKENNKTRKQQQGVDAARELRFSITEKPPCRFWQLGRCSKGSECPYPHTGQQASKLIACKFHQRGACKLGSECRFSHDDVSRQPCPDLVLYHKCRSVEGGCPYSHQQLEPELAQALRRMLMKMQEEEQQQQQQRVSGQQFVVTEPGQQQQATGGLVQQQQHQLQTLQHAMYLQAGVGPSWHGQQQLHQIPPGIASQLQQQPVHGMAGHPVNHLYPQHAGQQRPCPRAWSLPGQIMPPS